MSKRISIVVTTIFEPRFLDGYIDNLEKAGRSDEVEILVIPDRKTPATVYERCAFHESRGKRVICPTLDEQETFLRRFPPMAGRIPYDSDNRRNIGFLMALDHGCEILISIDDDNFCIDESDFAGEHAVTGTGGADHTIESSDRWINLCSLLESNAGAEIYPRGFPYFARHRERDFETAPAESQRVAVNVGLWLSDPDVDAITRLALAPGIRRYRGKPLLLGARTWTPINTQNTAIARDAIAAYYYVRMGYSLRGLTIDRYGDILSGYFLQRCVKARGETIRVGTPIADHRRTPHNLFKDLYHELAGMVLLETLLPWLLDLDLGSGEYRDLYAALADALDAQSEVMSGFIWDEGGREFLRQTAANMRAWLETVAIIG